MTNMFGGAGCNATNWDIGDLSDWDVSSVSNMTYMFGLAGYKATVWNIGDLSNWNVSRVNNMSQMFADAGVNASTLDIGDLSKWNVSNTSNMSGMFNNAGRNATTWHIGNLSNWDVSRVNNMSQMFSGAGVNASTWDIGNLSKWDVSSVNNMNSVFSNAGRNAATWYIGDLSNWDVSRVRNIYGMFSGAGYSATNFKELDLSGWDVSSVTNMNCLFYETGNKALQTIKTPYNISGDVTIADITNRIWYDITDNNKEYIAGTFPIGITGSHLLMTVKDETAPYLVVDSPISTDINSPVVVTSNSCIISGSVSDNESGLKSLTINGESVEVLDDNTFTYILTLEENVTAEVIIKAIDEAGNSSIETRYAIYDNAAPSISITTPMGTSSNRPAYTALENYTIVGTAFDASGIASLTINGAAVTVANDGSWSYTLSLSVNVTTSVTIISTDTVGQSTAITRYVEYDAVAPTLVVITPQSSTSGEPTYATSNTYLVTGNVYDAAGIQQVTVNGKVANIAESGSWHTNITLSDKITQKITIVATDMAGNNVTEIRYAYYDSSIYFEDFVVTLRNRNKIGYTPGMTTLDIPETFYDEETTTWYCVVGIGYRQGDPTNTTYAAFAKDTALTHVTIPGSVKAIERYSFYNATGITELSLGYGIEMIGMDAFQMCNGLIQVSLPDSITELGSAAFMESKQLNSINLPKGLSEVYSHLFNGCHQLTGQMLIPNGVKAIGTGAFMSTKITSVSIPISVTRVNDDAYNEAVQNAKIHYQCQG